MMPSTPIAITSSKKRATRSGSAPSNKVQLMLIRKPRSLAVQMHVPAEIRVRLVLVELLLEQQRVGAEIDELLAGQDALDDLRHLLVQQRLAAGDGDDRGAALIDRGERVGDGEALVEDLRR